MNNTDNLEAYACPVCKAPVSAKDVFSPATLRKVERGPESQAHFAAAIGNSAVRLSSKINAMMRILLDLPKRRVRVSPDTGEIVGDHAGPVPEGGSPEDVDGTVETTEKAIIFSQVRVDASAYFWKRRTGLAFSNFFPTGKRLGPISLLFRKLLTLLSCPMVEGRELCNGCCTYRSESVSSALEKAVDPFDRCCTSHFLRKVVHVSAYYCSGRACWTCWRGPSREAALTIGDWTVP